ncbi:MAG: LPS export ABC transporter periplasmic protein LptC [Prevotellaceae bacterium]|jgi:LPS export ABC transporter protein LptC|nr:LPS export ABC transporter periplasmic protein LptC [Prevotellaceae bacterium]
MNKPRLSFGAVWTVALLTVAAWNTGCDDDKNRISSIDDDKNIPTMELDSLFINYTEKGLLRMTLRAPEVQRFLLSDEPYSIFPKGIHILFYTELRELESEIVADYALNREKPEEMWMAVGHVEIENYVKQQKLYTDTLYWNRAQKTIYTDAPVRIVSPDSEIPGLNGMVSDERFEEYEIRNVNDGHMYVAPDAPADSLADSMDTATATDIATPSTPTATPVLTRPLPPAATQSARKKITR